VELRKGRFCGDSRCADERPLKFIAHLFNKFDTSRVIKHLSDFRVSFYRLRVVCELVRLLQELVQIWPHPLVFIRWCIWSGESSHERLLCFVAGYISPHYTKPLSKRKQPMLMSALCSEVLKHCH